MLHRPNKSRRLWDTTLFFWNDKFHMFYLNQNESGTLGHAVSKNLIRWVEKDLINLQGTPGSWNEKGVPLTGCIVRHKNLFYLYGGTKDPDTRKQIYGLFLSDDLYNWKPYSNNPVLEPESPYCTEPLPYDDYMFSAWRDPKIIKNSKGIFHAFLCARMPEWSSESTGACVAHLKSRDLINWESLQPVVIAGDKVRYCEVPDIFKINDVYYLIFLDHGWGGSRINTPTRDDVSGTFYMIADKMEGPFRWPDDPLLVGTGHHRIGPWAARIIKHQGQHLLYHHICSSKGSAFASPKVIRQNQDQTLSLKYYPFAEQLEKSMLVEKFDNIPHTRETDQGQWKYEKGRLIGTAPAMGTAAVIAEKIKNIHLQCSFKMLTGAAGGFVVRTKGDFDPEEFISPTEGVAIIFDYERQMVRIEKLKFISLQGWGPSTGEFMAGKSKLESDSCKYEFRHGLKYRVRCIVRDEFFEVYLDDNWIFSISMTDAPTTGGVDCFVERGTGEFSDIRLASIECL